MAMWIERVNLPTEVGFYWARTSGIRWWNLVVMVHGNSPFFKVDIWKYMDDLLLPNASVYDIEEFGPQIIAEAPVIEGMREDWK